MAPNYCGICGEPFDDAHTDVEQHASHGPDADCEFCEHCGAELTGYGSCDNDHAEDEA